ncbi:MAG: transglutaminase domain-containing protein [Desulfobacter sp.]|nr:transglutaminase domain-containing protein [Desulfobacter sp.]WDP88202.1 MAG: transglutaminase domain-containing protein [Desulfobacter sp.]
MQMDMSPTFFIDSDHPEIKAFSTHYTQNAKTDLDKAIGLYYAVRDEIRYDPYSIDPRAKTMKASYTLEKKKGYCVAKAVLLAACVRSQGIPARLGFADVKNHLTTDKLKQRMGTDLFVWHGYTDIFLNDKWVKATPAFNLGLCKAFGVLPLEFDGIQDSVFHPLNAKGDRHMEYVRDHGRFSDLPWDTILKSFMKTYPDFHEKMGPSSNDFRGEALAENIKKKED